MANSLQIQNEQVFNKTGLSNTKLMGLVYESGIMQRYKLSSSCYTVLTALCFHYNTIRNDSYPSQESISLKTGLSVKTIQRGINELLKLGFLMKARNLYGNVYKFTNKFFDELNLSHAKRHFDASESDILTPSYHEHKNMNMRKEHTSYTNVVNKQEDYKKNDDVVFSKPSNIQEYKQAIEKLESWNVLNPKTIIRHHKLERVKTIIEITESKAPNNPGAYFRSLLNVPNITTQKNTGIKNNVKDELPINRMVKCKYWKHIPTGRVLKALPEVGTHILFKYWKDSETVTFLFENDFTDKLENFTTDINNNELPGR